MKRWRDEPLGTRLYLEKCLGLLARFIGYEGKRPEEVKSFMDGHRARYGEQPSMWALHELTMRDEKTGLTVLRPEARKACRVLLGSPPESDEYADYWRRRDPSKVPVKEPPKEEPPEPPKKRRTGKG